ncbi:MAG: putative porin, partial [Cytophagales bacterium]
MIKKCYIISITILFSLVSEAQILDDSTKQVYNQNTTFYFHEIDVIDGELDQYNPDTSINFVHRYNWQTINNNLYQDLGNLGSALFPVFYKARKSIGTNYGINIYDEYFENPDEVRYFNTRSPFTELKYVQGANNFSNLRAEFSRNIGPYFNSTFKVDRFTSDKNLANVGRDRLVEHWSFIYNSNYRSKNGRYKVLYHYSHLSHEVEEQGGIRPLLSDRIPDDLYLYQSANVWLNDAFTWERRNNHHL